MKTKILKEQTGPSLKVGDEVRFTIWFIKEFGKDHAVPFTKSPTVEELDLGGGRIEKILGNFAYVKWNAENEEIQKELLAIPFPMQHLRKLSPTAISGEANTTAGITGIQATKPPTNLQVKPPAKNISLIRKEAIKRLRKTVRETVSRFLKEGKEYVVTAKSPSPGRGEGTNIAFEFTKEGTVLFYTRGSALDEPRDPGGQEEARKGLEILRMLFNLLEEKGLIHSALGAFDINKHRIIDDGMAEIEVEVPEKQFVDMLNRSGLNVTLHKDGDEYKKLTVSDIEDLVQFAGQFTGKKLPRAIAGRPLPEKPSPAK